MKKSLALILFSLCFLAMRAQDSLRYKHADYYYENALDAFDRKSYDTACAFANLHLDEESRFIAPRQDKMIGSYIIKAFCVFREGQYKQAIETYNEGLKWIDKAGSAEFADAFFDFVDVCYTMMESTDSVYFTYSDKDYRKSFVFRIEEVEWRRGTKFRVILNGGINDGVVKGAVAFPVSAPVPKDMPERIFQLGKGEIVEVYPWYSIAEVDIYNEKDTNNWIYEGDVLETRILSKFKDETTIYKLLATDVFFRNNNREKFVNPRYILHYDNKTFQSLMLQLMGQQIFETEEYTREGDMFLNPAEVGQNQGKSIHQLFLNPDTADIHDFLKFVHGFPRKYMGKDYKVNETYATWLLNNSPSTPNEILDSLLREVNPQRWLAILQFNKSDLTKDFYTTWGERATEFSGKQQYSQAAKCIEMVLLAANYLGRTEIKAYGHYQNGVLLKTQSRYADAIAAYDSAAKTYLQMGDSIEYTRSIYNVGVTYGDWAKYKEAIASYQKAEDILYKKLKQGGTYEQNELLAYLLWNKGYTLSKKGDNDGAIKSYDLAEGILNKIGGSKTDRATLYRNNAIVNKNKGDYNSALERFRQALKLYYEVGNMAKYAIAYDDIADTYFKMGQYRDAITYFSNAYTIKMSLDDVSGAGSSKSNIGQAYWNLGMYDSAMAYHRQAIALNQQVNDVADMAYSYKKIAELWEKNGRVDSATAYYNIVEELYTTNNDTTDKLADLKSSLGDVYYNVKNYTQAINYYQLSKKMYEYIGNDIGIANGLYNIALCYYNIKSYGQAAEYLREAKAKYQSMDDKEQTMHASICLALIKWTAENNFKEAEKLMQESLLLAKQSSSLTNQGYAWQQLGWLQKEQGKLEVSKKYYDSALSAYTQSGDYWGIGYTKLGIGLYYIEKGEFAKSRQLYWQVANEATEKNNNLLASHAYISLADYYNLVGEYDSAKYVVNTSLHYNKKEKNEYIQAGSYISLGNTYNYLAQNKDAVKHYFMADSVYSLLNDPISRTTPINNIGTIFFAQGDYTNALIQFNNAYEIFTKASYKGEMLLTAMLNIGEVYYEDGLLPEAEKWLNEGLKASASSGNKRGVSSANLLLGKVALKKKQHDAAKTYLQTALNNYKEIGEKERIIEANTYLGKLYIEKGVTDIAQKYLEQGVVIAKQTGNTRYQWEPLYLLSTISLKNRDTAKTVNQLKDAVDIVENMKGNLAGSKKNLSSFAKAQNKYKLYQDLVSLLVAQNDVKAAFYYQEKANIAGLLEQTRGGDNGPTRANELLAEVEDASKAKELELKIDGYYGELIKERSKPADQQSPEKINKLLELINVNETGYQDFVDSAAMANGGEHGSFSNTINPKELDNARFDLGDEDIVLEYLATENQLVIFAASNSSLNARKVNIKEADLRVAIQEFYHQVSNPKTDYGVLTTNSNNLYNIFIAPVADLLAGKKRIAVVPTGIVYNLPMQALGKKEGEKIKYIIADYDITYVNNIQFVNNAQSQAVANLEKVMCFGNADNSLSSAEKEVFDISSLFPTALVFVRDSATEDKAKQLINQFELVHFATHGRLDPINFKNSYLVLAPNPAAGDDGKFTMIEIRQFKNLRKVKLMVLSACDMAVSDEKAEGWINTPANEFITKGVKAVVAPLWKVHDEATSELMAHFYRNLKDQQSFSEALKNAQLSLSQSENFSHPYYWSAFENIGAW